MSRTVALVVVVVLVAWVLLKGDRVEPSADQVTGTQARPRTQGSSPNQPPDSTVPEGHGVISVRSSEGLPVENARVTFIGTSSGDCVCDSGGDGLLPEGEFLVVVRSAGFESVTESLVVQHDSAHQISLNPLGSVAVVITDELGAAIEGKEVWLLPPLFTKEPASLAAGLQRLQRTLKELQRLVLEASSLSLVLDEVLHSTSLYGDPKSSLPPEWVLVGSATNLRGATDEAGVAEFTSLPAGGGYRFCVLDEPFFSTDPTNPSQGMTLTQEGLFQFTPASTWQRTASGEFFVIAGVQARVNGTLVRSTAVSGRLSIPEGRFEYGQVRCHRVLEVEGKQTRMLESISAVAEDGSFHVGVTPGKKLLYGYCCNRLGPVYDYYFYSLQLDCPLGGLSVGELTPDDLGPSVNCAVEFRDERGRLLPVAEVFDGPGPHRAPFVIGSFGLTTRLDLDLDTPFVLHGLAPRSVLRVKLNRNAKTHAGLVVKRPQGFRLEAEKECRFVYRVSSPQRVTLQWRDPGQRIRLFVKNVAATNLRHRSLEVSTERGTPRTKILGLPVGRYDLVAYTEGENAEHLVATARFEVEAEGGGVVSLLFNPGAEIQALVVSEHSGKPIPDIKLELSLEGWYDPEISKGYMYRVSTNEFGEALFCSLPPSTRVHIHAPFDEVVGTGPANQTTTWIGSILRER